MDSASCEGVLQVAEPNEIIDIAGCAQLLCCDSQNTIANLARRGRLPGLKFGRSWVFLRSQVLETFREMALQEAKERRDRLATPDTRLEWTGKPGRRRRRLVKVPD
jgi:hypothetical protein